MQEPENIEKYLLKTGDIVISRAGSVGFSFLFSGVEKAVFASYLIRFRIKEGIDKRYVYYFLKSPEYWEAIGASKLGIAVQNVNATKLSQLKIPIAPIQQQKRIVEEIEKQFSRLDEAVENLQRVKANLKRYKAAVLKAAVEGKLTEEWRKQNPDVEPASKLLKRILTERRTKWEEAELAKMKAKGKVPKDDKWKKKYKEPKAPEVVGLPSIPKNWTWASPAQLTSGDAYSLAIGPFGSNLKVSDYKDEGVPLVFVRNIRSEVFDNENTKYVSAAKAKELKAHQIVGGDILITKMGDPPGDACIYPVGSPQAIITADCIKWELSPHLTATEFFVNAVNSQLIKTQILQITKGVAQLKVSLARFKGVAFPLPPHEEQDQILNEVESRLTIIDDFGKSLEANLVRVERLQQSILQKAFSGNLVNQDPHDEPASNLLQRIKESKQTAKSNRRKNLNTNLKLQVPNYL